jgi:DNA-binding MarR family transcriptional regulator
MGCEYRIGSDLGCKAYTSSSVANGFDRAAIERIVGKLIGERRRRSNFLGSELFADPAWDLLLALTLEQSREHRISVSGLCERVDVPPTTALRWIAKMAHRGLFVLREDVTDKRRKFIELSAETYAMMVAYCSTGKDALPLAA